MPGAKGIFIRKKRLLIYGGIMVFLVAILMVVIGVQRILDDPNIPLLLPEKGADWIRFRQPPDFKSRHSQILTTYFRTSFSVAKEIPQPVLTFRAMKRTVVCLDGRIIFTTNERTQEWKKIFHVTLPLGINPGKHELLIAVMNKNGHPALIAYCEPLALATGEHWESSADGKAWTSALSVRSRQYPLDSKRYYHLKPSLQGDSTPLPLKFQRADRAFLSKAPAFLTIFITVVVLTLLGSRKEYFSRFKSQQITSAGIRWIVLVAWICMSINNIWKVPLYAGMDWTEHLKYIEYVASTWRIPLPSEGWQMFQPPLYYFISALLYNILIPIFSWENVLMLLRIVPLACGALQIELCWRAVRYALPGREDLQIMGTIVGGLLPMNIYISQFIGNEPLAGCLSGIVVVLVIRYLRSPTACSRRFCISIGFFLGLSLLTKITAILLVPPVLLAMVWGSHTDNNPANRRFGQAFIYVSIILGIAFLVSGWYYIRNFLETGRFFIGGWDPSRNIVWWQDPSYRTLEQFYTFGESLFYPICSAVMGVWDSLYSTFWMDGLLSAVLIYEFRPPWNYDFMLAGAWLALLPTTAIGIGAVASFINFFKESNKAYIFCVLCILIYLAAILYLFLTVPIYSTAKATYALGIIPCFAVLCAEGFKFLTSRILLKAVVYGVLACFVFASYAAYFVL
ncbi:MAG: hypothetical protein ABFD82_16255 [Syntrophaceae bacterium]